MNFLKKTFGKKNKGKYIMSLDVGTNMAKALVSYVDFEKGTVANLGIGKAVQKTGNIVGGRIVDVDGAINACRQAAEQARKMAKTDVTEAIMGFSGNTTKICTDSFEIMREYPHERITEKELKSIIKDFHAKAFAEIKSSLTYREKECGIKLISSDVVDFSIDGYRVVNPLSFRGGKIVATISSSYVLVSDFDMIYSIAAKLGLKLMKVAYGPYAVIKAIGAQNTLGFNAILVDVGGNITDVVLVKRGNIQKAGMFILGGRVFTKRIANNFGISEDAAEEMKIRYSKGGLKEEEMIKIERMLSEDIQLWMSGVELILEEESTKMLIPSKFLFYGGSSQLPGLAASLNGLKNKNILFSDKINLDFMRLGHIAGNIDNTGKLDDFQDMTLVGLAHLCLDCADKEDVPNSFLSEII